MIRRCYPVFNIVRVQCGARDVELFIRTTGSEGAALSGMVMVVSFRQSAQRLIQFTIPLHTTGWTSCKLFPL
jgi:hypothetical protein